MEVWQWRVVTRTHEPRNAGEGGTPFGDYLEPVRLRKDAELLLQLLVHERPELPMRVLLVHAAGADDDTDQPFLSAQCSPVERPLQKRAVEPEHGVGQPYAGGVLQVDRVD